MTSQGLVRNKGYITGTKRGGFVNPVDYGYCLIQKSLGSPQRIGGFLIVVPSKAVLRNFGHQKRQARHRVLPVSTLVWGSVPAQSVVHMLKTQKSYEHAEAEAVDVQLTSLEGATKGEKHNRAPTTTEAELTYRSYGSNP